MIAQGTVPATGAEAGSAPTAPEATATAGPTAVSEGDVQPQPEAAYTYDPSGRRDPFTALIKTGKDGGKEDKDLPPLQRVGLTELSLIGVIWGGFGYTAMVQTPDGKGYTVRRGTRVGPDNGVVTKITQQGIIVTERFTDIYGKSQEREHVKHLHTEGESE